MENWDNQKHKKKLDFTWWRCSNCIANFWLDNFAWFSQSQNGHNFISNKQGAVLFNSPKSYQQHIFSVYDSSSTSFLSTLDTNLCHPHATVTPTLIGYASRLSCHKIPNQQKSTKNRLSTRFIFTLFWVTFTGTILRPILLLNFVDFSCY